MSEKTRRSSQAILALALLAGMLLACSILTSEKAVPTNTPVPDSSGTRRAPLVPLSTFINADCPTQSLTGLTSNASPGALDCTWHWRGKFGADNAEMRIMQYPAAPLYQQVLKTDLQHLQQQAANLKSSPRKNDNLDVLLADLNNYIYMETYTGSATTDNPATPLCGDGWGAMGVHDQFEVTFYLRESCDISTSASDYSQVMTTLQKAALAAILRAEKSRQ
jgi:hypothetical protein